jgi:hypothetical protein
MRLQRILPVYEEGTRWKLKLPKSPIEFGSLLYALLNAGTAARARLAPGQHWLDLFLSQVPDMFRESVHRTRLDLQGRELDDIAETLVDIVAELKKWPAYAQPTVRWAEERDFVNDRRPFDWSVELPHTFTVLPPGQSLSWLLMARILGSSVEGLPFGGRLAEARGYSTMGDMALASLALLTAPHVKQFATKIHGEIMAAVEETVRRMRDQDWNGVVEAEKDSAALLAFFQKQFPKKGVKGKKALLSLFAWLPADGAMAKFITTGAIGVVGGRGVGMVKSVPFDLALNQNFRTRFQFARLLGGRAFRHVNTDPREPRLTRDDSEFSQHIVASAAKRSVEVFVIMNQDPEGGRRAYSCGDVTPYASYEATAQARAGAAALAAVEAATRLIDAEVERGAGTVVAHPPGFPQGFAVYYRSPKVFLDDNFINTLYLHEVIVPVERQLSGHIVTAAYRILAAAGLQVGFYCG